MVNSLTIQGPDGSQDDEENNFEDISAHDFAGNSIQTAEEMVAFRKGAMYDYCILRAIEIAIPDKTMRDIMIDGRKPIKGLDCRTQKDEANHLEKCIVSFNGTDLIKATIKSSILPPDKENKDYRAVVQMVSLWSIDGKNTHIYGN